DNGWTWAKGRHAPPSENGRSKQVRSENLLSRNPSGSHFMTIPLCEPAGSHKSGALHNAPYANAARDYARWGQRIGAGPWPTKTMSRDSSKGLLRGTRGATKTRASFQT